MRGPIDPLEYIKVNEVCDQRISIYSVGDQRNEKTRLAAFFYIRNESTLPQSQFRDYDVVSNRAERNSRAVVELGKITSFGKAIALSWVQ